MKITLEYDGAKDLMRFSAGDSYVSESGSTFRGAIASDPSSLLDFARALRAMVLIMADQKP